MYRLYFLIITCAFLFSCGYNFAGFSPVQMPENKNDMFLGSVLNPTQDAWLEPYLRANFRDELTRRGGVNWVSQKQAQAIVNIDIQQLRTSEGVTGKRDKTVKNEVVITMKAEIVAVDTGEAIWSSGSVVGRSSYFLDGGLSMAGIQGPGLRSASEEAVDEAITRLVDRLGDGF
ncbi:MAG: LPS assembly lipoprotein LptE [Desulfonatronovibrio sp.]